MQRRLEEENQSLRRQLEAVLEQARRNEDKLGRFDQLERQLIGAGSFVELVRLLLSEYALAFGVEHVSLALVDHDYEATRILEADLGHDLHAKGLILLQSPVALAAMYGPARRPWLGAFDAAAHGSLFHAAAPGAIASVALLPLVRQDELIGSLHFGSHDPQRYSHASGTSFLERLAAVASVCLVNALNQERLKLIGLTDGLTGVQNRRYFEHRAQVEVLQARRYRHPLACMFLDIDRFKRINDSHGHQTGDEVLRGVGRIIQGQLRAGDTIARYGGEEFVVLLPQAGSHHAREIAERIRASIEAKAFQTSSGQTIGVTISIGMAMLPTDQSGWDPRLLAERLVAAADRAVYQAKHTGRNRVVFEGAPAVVATRGAFVQSLKRAVRRAGWVRR